MKTITLICSLFLLPIAGCAGEPAEAPEPQRVSFLTEPPVGAWRLVAFGDATEVAEPEVAFQVEADGKISGTSGCNRYFGQWTRKDGWVSVGPIGGTRMMCPPEIMDVEDRFLGAFEKTAGWKPHVDGLVLVDAAGDPLLVFEKAP